MNNENTMEIILETDDKKGRFILMNNNEQAGLMTFTMAGEIMIISHTEVDPSFEGKGLGKKLVAAAVDHARKNNLKIKPLCPFANRVLQHQRDEVQDVLF